jgi:hypothetical protein
VFAALLAMLALGGCGGGVDREPIRLTAAQVGGGTLHYDDLASEDTMLWFWAPW